MDRGKGLFLPEDENLREKGDWSQFTLWQQGMHARILIAVSFLSLSCQAVLIMRGSNYHFNEGEFVSVETKVQHSTTKQMALVELALAELLEASLRTTLDNAFPLKPAPCN